MIGPFRSQLLRVLVAVAIATALTVLLTMLPLNVPPTQSFAHRLVTQNASPANNHPFCSEIDKTLWASAGARMWCFPPGSIKPSHTRLSTARRFGTNVNAADPAEDVTPGGVRGYGQSETSIAGIGPYVVEAWNDAMGFLSPCPSPQSKEEGTGLGFSADGGASFVDEGGLPNANCNAHKYQGDPSVEAWSSGGSDYFYISSLFDTPTPGQGDPNSYIAFTACKASGRGAAATLKCSQPIIMAASTQCITSMCSFLDKEYLSIDPQRGRLYVTYTEFGLPEPPDSRIRFQIELAVCDIGTPSGGVGPAGGTASHPVCKPGGPGTTARPYLVVAPKSRCENSGAYPAVDVARGDIYIGYESNIFSFFPDCVSLPTQNVVARVPFSCLAPVALTSPCKGPAAINALNVVSMVLAPIPGYSRFPFQDFPRIAVSDHAGTVSLVWNDGARNPLGDILLQSFRLGSLSKVQRSPVQLNSQAAGIHIMPALRNTNRDGTLNVSWYERASPSTTLTSVSAAINLDPLTTRTPAPNVVVTTAPTDWASVVSFLGPNFGDYTDNYVVATGSAPYTGTKLYVAWSDGRIGIPQPFEAYTATQ